MRSGASSSAHSRIKVTDNDMPKITLDLQILLAQLKAGLLRLSGILPTIAMPMIDPQPANPSAQKIYDVAKSLLGTDASPADIAPDSLACAETVNRIVKIAIGVPVGGGTSTFQMWRCLETYPLWQKILGSEALPGDIIISPTGSVTDARLEHGHVGIVAKHGILSNNSETGKLSENFDIPTWKRYYTQFGGLSTFFYRVVDK